MKIVSVELFATQLPLIRPFIVAYDEFRELPSIIVKLTTDTGLVGYGEGMPDPHVTGETFHSTYEMLAKDIAPLVIGKNPFHIENIHRLMAEAVCYAPSGQLHYEQNRLLSERPGLGVEVDERVVRELSVFSAVLS